MRAPDERRIAWGSNTVIRCNSASHVRIMNAIRGMTDTITGRMSWASLSLK